MGLMTFLVTQSVARNDGTLDFVRRYFKRLDDASRYYHGLDMRKGKVMLTDSQGVPIKPLPPNGQ